VKLRAIEHTHPRLNVLNWPYFAVASAEFNGR